MTSSLAAGLVMTVLLALGFGLLFWGRSDVAQAVGLVLVGTALGWAAGMGAADAWGWPS